MNDAIPVSRLACRFAAAMLAGEFALVFLYNPLGRDLDTFPAAVIVSGFAALSSLCFTAATAGWIPRLGWGRRWHAFAVGTGASFLPWAWFWSGSLLGAAEIPLDQLAWWGGSVTGVSCLGNAAALRAMDG